jgi:ubiquinone/menaquinone biosynthesis C-methylase UbiE
MIQSISASEETIDQSFPVPAHDIPTQDKIALIREVMAAKGEGHALDIGSGTGYTTYRVFGDRPTVCIDLHMPNLCYYRNRIASISSAYQPLCVVAHTTALPFKADVFTFILCSEVLEHLEDDGAAVQELARVLSSNGRAVITVPYTKLGFTSFLELFGIKSVHDFPGPERHVRPGYDEHTLQRLLASHGLEIDQHSHYLRFFTRLVTDLVSLAHLLYQRVVWHRRAWSWSEAALVEGSLAFHFYTWVFPVLWGFSRLDTLLSRMRGFGLVAAVRKRRCQ